MFHVNSVLCVIQIQMNVRMRSFVAEAAVRTRKAHLAVSVMQDLKCLHLETSVKVRHLSFSLSFFSLSCFVFSFFLDRQTTECDSNYSLNNTDVFMARRNVSATRGQCSYVALCCHQQVTHCSC